MAIARKRTPKEIEKARQAEEARKKREEEERRKAAQYVQPTRTKKSSAAGSTGGGAPASASKKTAAPSSTSAGPRYYTRTMQGGTVAQRGDTVDLISPRLRTSAVETPADRRRRREQERQQSVTSKVNAYRALIDDPATPERDKELYARLLSIYENDVSDALGVEIEQPATPAQPERRKPGTPVQLGDVMRLVGGNERISDVQSAEQRRAQITDRRRQSIADSLAFYDSKIADPRSTEEERRRAEKLRGLYANEVTDALLPKQQQSATAPTFNRPDEQLPEVDISRDPTRRIPGRTVQQGDAMALLDHWSRLAEGEVPAEQARQRQGAYLDEIAGAQAVLDGYNDGSMGWLDLYNLTYGKGRTTADMADMSAQWADQYAAQGDELLADYFGGAETQLRDQSEQLGKTHDSLTGSTARQTAQAREQAMRAAMQAATEGYNAFGRSLTNEEQMVAEAGVDEALAYYDAQLADPNLSEAERELYTFLRGKYAGEVSQAISGGDAVRYDEPMDAAAVGAAVEDYGAAVRDTNLAAQETRRKTSAALDQATLNQVQRDMKAKGISPETYAVEYAEQYHGGGVPIGANRRNRYLTLDEYAMRRFAEAYYDEDQYRRVEELIDIQADQRLNQAAVDVVTGDDPIINNPVSHAVLGVGGRISGMINTIDVALQRMEQISGDRTRINFYRTAEMPAMGEAAVEHTAEDLAQYGDLADVIPALEGTGIGRWSLGTIYQTGIDAAANLANAAMFGAGTGFATGLQAASGGLRDAHERGATDDEALALGFAQGLNEGLGEQISYGVFLNLGTKRGWFDSRKGKFALGLLQMPNEGLEEYATERLNQAADEAIMGVLSNHNTYVLEALAAGYSPDAAEQYAESIEDDQAIDAALSGMLAGAMRAGGTYAGQSLERAAERSAAYRDIGEAIQYQGNAEDMARLISDVTGKATKAAKKARKTGKQYAKFTERIEEHVARADEATRDIVRSKAEAVRNAPFFKIEGTSEETRQKAEARQEKMSVSESGAAVAGENVKLNGLASVGDDAEIVYTKSDGSKGQAKVSEVTFDPETAEVYAYAADMATPELANTFRMTVNRDQMQDIDRVANAYAQAYDMAKAGYRQESVARSYLVKGILQQQQLTEVYKLGSEARQTAQAQEVTQAAQRAQKNMGRKWQGGKATFDRSVVTDALSDEQRSQIDLASVITGSMGINVVFFESQANDAGVYTAENGRYDRRTNTIYLDVNAGRNYAGDSMTDTALMRTLSHEITHAIQRNSPEIYAELRDMVVDVLGDTEGVTIDDLIDAKMARDSSLTDRSAALDEVVADACETMLRDSDAIQRVQAAHPDVVKTMGERLREIATRIIEAIKSAFTGRRLSTEAQLLVRNAEQLKTIADKWAEGAVQTAEVSGREHAEGSEDNIDNTEAFLDSTEAIQNQARPPYTDGTKACTEFVGSLNSEARSTYDLLYNFYQASRLGKQNLSSKFMYYDQWNENVRNNAAWAERARAMAATLPDEVRRKMNMNEDGTLNPTSLEVEFKMNRSMGQRIIDALETEVIDTKYTIEGHEYTLSRGNTANAVGGEAYRRAICEETRKAYRNGTLKQASIGTLSKDRWGSLGFLATNGKTGASGDFTTLCPQMFYNKGCYYCYRLAALKSGVNNKLVGANVWYGGEILRIRDKDVNMLNENGGLRIQSFGDWMPQFSSQLADMLYDAEMRGLQVKIITKEPSMIEYVALLREQGLGKSLYFNLSADYAIERAGTRETADYTTMNTERPYMRDESGDLWWKRAMTVQEANKYRQKYPWVNTRIVATTQKEFIRGLKDPTVDVVTGYHGNIREWERIDSETGAHLVNVEPLGDAGMPKFEYDVFTDSWHLTYEGKTGTHKALAKAIMDENLVGAYYEKTCCITGRCATCKGKCGKASASFTVKNATNRDSESVAYWQQQMEYDESDVQRQARDPGEVSDREILANALESVAQTEEERTRLAAYKEGLAKLNSYQATLDENRAIIKELAFKKGRTAEENERLNKAKASVTTLRDKLARADAALLDLERMAPIRDIVKREGAKVREERNRVMRERVAATRQTHANAATRKGIARRVKRLNDLLLNPTDQRHIPEEFKLAVTDLLQLFANDTSVFDKARLERVRAAYAAIRESNTDAASMYDEDIANEITQLAEAIGGRRLSKLNADELKTVRNILDHFGKMVRDANNVFLGKRRASIDEMTKEIVEQTSGMRHLASRLKASKLAKWLTEGQITPPYFFKRLGGAMGKLGDEILAAEGSYGVELLRSTKRLRRIMAEHNHKSWANKRGDELKLETESGETITLTREQALGLYATHKREVTNTQQNAHHLRDAGIVFQRKASDLPLVKGRPMNADATPISDKDMAAIEAWLTDEQKRYADAMVKYISTEMGKLGNETSMQLHGYRKFGEEYYYPYKVSSDFLKTDFTKIEDALIKNMSFTKRTKTNASNPLVVTDFTETVADHVNKMLLYHNFAVAQDSFMRLYNHHINKSKTIKSALKTAYGNGIDSYISQFMRDMYGGVTRDMTDATADKMIGMYKRYTVMASLSVAVQQPSSLIRAFALVNPKYFRPVHAKGAFDEAMEYAGTAVIKSIGRFDTNVGRNVVEWMTREGIEGVRDAIDTAGGYLPELFDKISWGAIWDAVKREQAAESGLDINSTELKKRAGKRFDEVIRYTQVYDSTLARSQTMRSKSTWAKMVTAFMSEPTVVYNMMYDALLGADSTAKTKTKVFGAVLGSIVLNALLKATVTAARDDDDEKATYKERYVKNVSADLLDGLAPMGYVPLARDVWSIMQGYTVDRTDLEAVNLVKTAWDVVTSESASMEKKLRTIAQLTSMLSGVPLSNVWRDVDAVRNTVKSAQQETRPEWFSTALKRGLSDGLVMSMFVDDSKAANVDKLFEETRDGGNEIDKIRQHLIDYNGVEDDDEIDSLLRTRIREGYEGGEINAETARTMLAEHAGLTANEAEKRVNEWSYTVETGAAYSDMKESYMSGEITAEDAVEARVTYGGAEREAAEDTVAKWEFEAKHGYAYSDLREEYQSGSVSRQDVLDALTTVGGKDADEAYWTLSEWDYGDDWHGKTTRLNAALVGDDMSEIEAAMQELAAHSSWEKPGNELASAVTTVYKPMFEAATDAEKDEMREWILDCIEMAYDVAGEEYYGDEYALRYRNWLR